MSPVCSLDTSLCLHQPVPGVCTDPGSPDGCTLHSPGAVCSQGRHSDSRCRRPGASKAKGVKCSTNGFVECNYYHVSHTAHFRWVTALYVNCTTYDDVLSSVQCRVHQARQVRARPWLVQWPVSAWSLELMQEAGAAPVYLEASRQCTAQPVCSEPGLGKSDGEETGERRKWQTATISPGPCTTRDRVTAPVLCGSSCSLP